MDTNPTLVMDLRVETVRFPLGFRIITIKVKGAVWIPGGSDGLLLQLDRTQTPLVWTNSERDL